MRPLKGFLDKDGHRLNPPKPGGGSEAALKDAAYLARRFLRHKRHRGPIWMFLKQALGYEEAQVVFAEAIVREFGVTKGGKGLTDDPNPPPVQKRGGFGYSGLTRKKKAP